MSIEQPSGMDVFAQAEKPGLVYGLPNSTYHSGKNSLSASNAKILLGKRAPTSREALEFGTLVHTVLLEPETAGDAYVCLNPDAIGVKADGTPASNPKATTAWKTAVSKAHRDGHQVVSPDDWDRANRMADAVRGHKRAAEILAACPHREVSAYAELEPGVMIRGRFDLLGDSLLADLKTCVDGDPDRFGRTAGAFGYHVSAGAYLLIAELLGLNIPSFEFVLCEKEPTPGGNYRVSVVQLDDLYIAEGRKQFLEAVRRWVALGKTVDLPDYPDETVLVDMPAYLIDDDMEIS